MLTSFEISPEAISQQVEEIISIGVSSQTDLAVFTPRAKRALELAQPEAIRARSGQVRTEHLLAGLVREGEGVAAQVLIRLGADLNRVRRYMP